MFLSRRVSRLEVAEIKEAGNRVSKERLAVLVGMQLRVARLGAGLEQADVAEALGVHRQAVSRIENGRRMPSLDFIERYARRVGAPITLTMGLGGLAEADERRERAKAAIVPLREVDNWKDTMHGRMLATVLDGRQLSDPTASYLRLLEDAVPALGRYVLGDARFSMALAFAAACYEVIDWGKVQAALDASAMRSLHLKVARRVLHVIARPDRRQRAHTG